MRRGALAVGTTLALLCVGVLLVAGPVRGEEAIRPVAVMTPAAGALLGPPLAPGALHHHPLRVANEGPARFRATLTARAEGALAEFLTMEVRETGDCTPAGFEAAAPGDRAALRALDARLPALAPGAAMDLCIALALDPGVPNDYQGAAADIVLDLLAESV